MKLALTVHAWLDEELMYAQQLGADQVLARVTPGVMGEAGGEKPKLSALRNRVEKAGLELLGLDCAHGPLQSAASGASGLAQKSAYFCELIANAGEAGIGLIAYRWEGDQQNWDGLEDFLDRVVPAAEEAGVRLAGSFSAHPRADENYLQACARFLELWPSLLHGLDLAPDLPVSPDGMAQIRLLLKPGLRERLFLLTPGRMLPVGPSQDLIALLQMFQQAGSPASVRPADQSGVAGNLDHAYQDLAYTSGYLRASLQVMHRSPGGL